MSRVLVTGGAGRLGRSVVAHLRARGDEVVCVDLAAPPDDRDDRLAADLTSLAAARDVMARVHPAAIVHLAAISVPFSRPEPEILHTNSALAYNVHQAALEAGVGTVVTASSPTVLGYGAPNGWAPAYLPLDEDHPVRPWHAYALSKVVAEQTARMFAAQAGDRLRTATFRPCYVIAPEEWRGAPTQQGHTVQQRLGDPALAAPALFNYVDARDAAAFVAALLDRIADIDNGDVFLVGADDSLAREPVGELLPRFHPGTRHHADRLAADAPVFSSAKATRLLGWRPRHRWRTELACAEGSDLRSEPHTQPPVRGR